MRSGEHGLFFAPELSPSNRATIGGMIATDASGQGSVLYGKTRDHVLELKTVLLDGTEWHSAPAVGRASSTTVKRRTDRVGAVHRAARSHPRDDAELIAERFPKLNRCVTGYDLAHLRDEHGRFDLNSVLCGAEGTLGVRHRGQAQPPADPALHGAGQHPLRQLRRGAARRRRADANWRRPRARPSTPRCWRWRAAMRSG